jgi:hypothetical protein
MVKNKISKAKGQLNQLLLVHYYAGIGCRTGQLAWGGDLKYGNNSNFLNGLSKFGPAVRRYSEGG